MRTPEPTSVVLPPNRRRCFLCKKQTIGVKCSQCGFPTDVCRKCATESARKLNPTVCVTCFQLPPTSPCLECGKVFAGSGRCLDCWQKVLAKDPKYAEPTFDKEPFRYAAQYGRQAIVEMLRSRWCDRREGVADDD